MVVAYVYGIALPQYNTAAYQSSVQHSNSIRLPSIVIQFLEFQGEGYPILPDRSVDYCNIWTTGGDAAGNVNGFDCPQDVWQTWPFDLQPGLIKGNVLYFDASRLPLENQTIDSPNTLLRFQWPVSCTRGIVQSQKLR